ncbi:Membrane bound FAD containing D-sorbitol dehydrogenase [Paracoccus isoporae]|uniref:Membrane bound FAD containing D-sorbitol dehydrogenase n=1 Tax=Paracoccus isoporae TaxID=591205 RepID=A0A1G7F7N8_9RHOB|nr:sugar dehydrogenase complex small subunit [Paracoccus isoporae]SDE71881.1 Membrane bound FAD containing D-sorbitol dehydrogenase [Paracoccus isoporae]
MRAAPTRRALLRGGASAAALAVMPGMLMPGAAVARSLNDVRDRALFHSVLYALAGPVEMAPQLLGSVSDGFVAKFGAAALDDLVAHVARAGVADVLTAQSDPTREAHLQWLTAALFTGSADPDDKTAQMVNYPVALCWKSLSFAKAPALCAGPEFGYWNGEWGAA